MNKKYKNSRRKKYLDHLRVNFAKTNLEA